MDPHRHDEGVRTKAIERCRRLLGHDPELQRLAPSREARDRLAADGTTSLRCAALACEIYADRPAFGERASVVEHGRLRTLPSLRYLTYAELWERVRAFAAGLRHLGVADTGAIVGLLGFASVDWVVADLACLYLGAVSVPLQTAANAAEIRAIVNEARISTVVSSLAQLDLCAAVIAGAPSVQALVVMEFQSADRAQAEALARAKQRIEGVHGRTPTVLTMPEVERVERDRGPVPPVDPVSNAVLRSIVYTSGSTGSPKGAMFPESIWAQYWQAIWPWDIPEVPYVGVDYMPLNHMAGRGGIVRSIISGGVTTFVHAPDMSTLFEDIRLARPTSLFLVPRAANMIHQHFQTEVVRRGASEEQVMAEMRRSFLGDRLVYVVTGTAPTAPEVASFLERCFEVPVIDGYGSTEAGAITIENRIARDNVIAYDLVDVPELGYTKRDQPHPRGELRVKVRRAIPGYYQNPEATAVLFDDEGYLRTGDIVEERGPDEVVWIDRKKNVLKLSQGEFVSTSRLEELFSANSPYIRQVYVHGSSLQSYLLAVVVPEGRADKALIRRELDRIAAQEGLKGYEIPRDFLIADEPFTRENGLLTESNKPSRHRIRARYGEQLSALFVSIERAQLEELYALERDRGEDRPVQEKIARALCVTLGLPGLEPGQEDLGLVQLGGDSLGGVRLAGLIEDLTGVHVPVGLVLDPSSSVRSLARYVEERRRGEGAAKRPSFAEVHGAGAQTVKAEDLRVERFVDAGDLAAKAPAEPLPPARVVLLTGANGFLGRFLLLELLARVPRPGGKVVAVVRASDDRAARERLARAYAGVDPTLSARFASLAGEGRLEVVAGDLIKPRLGLPEARWEALAGEVDAIVHNGALVNHAFSYAQLFEPNVLGTAEVARLALRRRFASIGFVSTVGVAAGVDRADPIREDEDAASLWRERPVNTGYAVGYATSKWADEILLRDLEARTGVPVTVFRCSMILPPSSYVGQVNTGDFLTRLLQSVVETGLAPRSFYADPSGPHGFDGLPVDFVARSIASVALERRPGFATCHVVAGQRDVAPSLDAIVDWVARAGYRVDRSLDHPAWLRAFRDRLRALPAAEQQRSALPILHQWERPLGREVFFENRCLRARIEALTPGGPTAIPAMDEMFVRQYLKNMVYLRLIGHPPLSTAA